jgi:hypothetical protein
LLSGGKLVDELEQGPEERMGEPGGGGVKAPTQIDNCLMASAVAFRIKERFEKEES